jgi:hypothetical protein
MSAAALKLLLAEGAVVSDRLSRAAALCDGWYATEPELAPFIIRSIFRDLTEREWDDPQGAPTAEYTVFAQDVLPQMEAVLDAIVAGADPLAALRGLVRGFNGSQLSPPVYVQAPPTP